MKKKPKTWVIFLSGLLLGALLMGVGAGVFFHSRPVSQSKTEEPGETPAPPHPAEWEEPWEVPPEDVAEDLSDPKGSEEEKTPTPDEEESAVEESRGNTEDTWDREAVYVGGDEVIYGGKIYRAKWWTQGETPGQADVWEDTLIAAGQSVEKPTELPEEVPDDPRTDVEKREGFKVVGYFPSWKESTDKIQYDVLTHINYAFAIPTAEGDLLPLENDHIAKKIIAEAHKRDVKVFIAIGGWSYHDVPLEATFMSATETAEKRAKLADAIVELCDTYGFDGVDLDWEHPRVDGDSSARYEGLILELADRLHSEGKELSSAVLSGVTADGNVYYDAAAHTDKVLETVDWINVMAYDGGDGERHSAYDFAVNCGAYWRKNRGMPVEKVVLGVPFYARPSWAAYGDILAAVPNAWEKDTVSYNGMEVWYNGISTIEKKTAYALDHLGGVMIWEVSQDASGEHSLQTAIGRTIKESK